MCSTVWLAPVGQLISVCIGCMRTWRGTALCAAGLSKYDGRADAVMREQVEKSTPFGKPVGEAGLCLPIGQAQGARAKLTRRLIMLGPLVCLLLYLL